MEKNEEEIIDSGIVGCSVTDDLQEQVEQLSKELEDVREERDDLATDLEWTNNDLDLANQRIEYLTSLPNKTKEELIADIKRRLSIDNLLSAELEEWIDNYIKFYMKDV